MGKDKILVKVNTLYINTKPKIQPDGKYICNIDPSIKIEECSANTRVAVRNDSYLVHRILPTRVDPLVSLMKVEKVPDSTYDMIGGIYNYFEKINYYYRS